MVQIFDEFAVDYVILARYMRVLPARHLLEICRWPHHQPSSRTVACFPGMRPYHDAYASRMLVYGATCHFIVPGLDAGNQIIQQRTFSVPPGTPLESVIEQGHLRTNPSVWWKVSAASSTAKCNFTSTASLPARRRPQVSASPRSRKGPPGHLFSVPERPHKFPVADLHFAPNGHHTWAAMDFESLKSAIVDGRLVPGSRNRSTIRGIVNHQIGIRPN